MGVGEGGGNHIFFFVRYFRVCAMAATGGGSGFLSGLSRRELQALAKEHGVKGNMKSVDIILALQQLGVSEPSSSSTGFSSSRAVAPVPSRVLVKRMKKWEGRDVVQETYLLAEALRVTALNDFLEVDDFLAWRATCREGAASFQSMGDDFVRALERSSESTLVFGSKEISIASGMVSAAAQALVPGSGTRAKKRECVLAGIFAFGSVEEFLHARGLKSKKKPTAVAWSVVEACGGDEAMVEAAIEGMRVDDGRLSEEERERRYYAGGGDDRGGIRDAFLRNPVEEGVGLREVLATRRMCTYRVGEGEFHALQYTRSDVDRTARFLGKLRIQRLRLKHRFKAKITTEQVRGEIDTDRFWDSVVRHAKEYAHARPRRSFGYRGGYESGYDSEDSYMSFDGFTCWRCGEYGHFARDCYM